MGEKGDGEVAERFRKPSTRRIADSCANLREDAPAVAVAP